MNDDEVAVRTRARCKEAISGPPVPRRSHKRYKGRIHQIRPDNAKNTNPQLQSPFFSKLPYDVRVMIYEDILRPLSFTTFWNLHRDYRGYSKCGLIRSETCNNSHSRHAWKGFDDHCPALSRQCDDSFIDLFLTCRRVHFEAMHIFYSRTPFVVFDLRGFQALITRTPTQYLDVVTSLKLTWFVFPPLYLRAPTERAFYGKHYDPTPTEKAWSALCFKLARMPMLSKILITIHNFNLTGPGLLEPLIEAFTNGEETTGVTGLGMQKADGKVTDQEQRKNPRWRRVSHFEVAFGYDGSLPFDITGTNDLPFRVRLLEADEDWKSASGAKVWPPPSFREMSSLDVAGRRVMTGVGRCYGAARGLVRNIRLRIG